MASPETTPRKPRRWPSSEWLKLAGKLRHAANVMSLPATPETWPDWMTPEKRKSMSEHFIEAAAEIEATHVKQ
jgi:hypothetical protein